MPKDKPKKEPHEKITKKYLLKISNDDVSIRRTIKNTLMQAQQQLALMENEIANEDPFDTRVKTIENLLSGLRTVTEEIGGSVTSAELFFRIAKINGGIEAIDRVAEFNGKLLALANDLVNQVKSNSEFSDIKEKINEIREMYTNRQRLLSTSNIA